MSKTSFVHELQTRKRYALLRWILHFCSGVYGFITHMRNLAYKYQIFRSKKLDAPVISIGNIIAGGTGKTPFVVWLVQNLPIDLPKTILLSRGYGGDEQQLFAASLPSTPHVTGSKRFCSGVMALQKYGQNIFFVLDDAFQHRQLHRDLDIVLIDATCPFGYDYMLPRGFLREYLYNLQRADAFVITRSDMVTRQKLQEIRCRLRAIVGDKLQLFSRHVATHFIMHKSGKKCDKQTFANKKALIFCGIGNPESFRYLVESLQVKVLELIAFDDHYHYRNEDIKKLIERAEQQQVEIIITTAKDAVKLPKDINVAVLHIAIDIEENKELLIKMIEDKIK